MDITHTYSHHIYIYRYGALQAAHHQQQVPVRGTYVRTYQLPVVGISKYILREEAREIHAFD